MVSFTRMGRMNAPPTPQIHLQYIKKRKKPPRVAEEKTGCLSCDYICLSEAITTKKQVTHAAHNAINSDRVCWSPPHIELNSLLQAGDACIQS